MHIRSTQTGETEMVTEEKPSTGHGMEEGRRSLDEPRGAQPLNRSACEFTFHLPPPEMHCAPVSQAFLPASQEDLDHLKMLVADSGEVLEALQNTTGREAGSSKYQDLISEALPDVREANLAFYEVLGKFLQGLEDHAQGEHHSYVEDDKKKLREHLWTMDHMLQVTSRLAKHLDQISQNLLETLMDPVEKIAVPTSRNPLGPF